MTIDPTTSFDHVARYLERSKVSPLSIEFNCNVYTLEALRPSPGDILSDERLSRLLVEHIHHWQRFQYYATAIGAFRLLTQLMQGKSAPLLEDLELVHPILDTPWDEEPVVPDLFKGPASIPKLSMLMLKAVGARNWGMVPYRNLGSLRLLELYGGPSNLTLPLLGLTPSGVPYLELCLTVEQFTNLLRSSPQLESMEFRESPISTFDLDAVFRTDEAAPIWPSPVLLPNLLELHLGRFRDPNVVSNLFYLIQAPNLSELSLCNFHHLHEEVDMTPALVYLAGDPANPRFPRLETLELRRIAYWPTPQLGAFFKSLPSLVKLRLSEILQHDDGNILWYLLPDMDALTGTLTEDEVAELFPCPDLESLHTSEVDASVYTTVLQQRTRFGLDLLTLAVDEDDNMTEEIRETLQGMRIDIRRVEEEWRYEDY